MKKVGIIGWPVTHSISPAMHNAAFAALGLNDWHYDLLPTPPESLAEQVRSLPDNGYVGVNVTIPHKQNVMPLLNGISVAARGIGAVNTVLIEGRRLEGHNTDSIGFMLDLEANGIQIQGQRVLVLGAGGSARAVVLGLANRGAQVIVMARREQTAWQLREDLRQGITRQFDIEVQPLSALPKIAQSVHLIVNCTPAGMWPEVANSPWPEEIPIPPQAAVYDLVYRPAKTRLLQQAEAAGVRAIGGLGMLIYQGAAAFELWTGQEAPVEVMRSAALSALNL